MEFKYFKAEVEQERQQERQNSVQILQSLGMRCSEIEFMKTQLEQERQNSITILQNFGILNQNFELLKAQFVQGGQKDLDIGKMQKEIEDLKTELRLKDKKIEEQQVDIDTIMDYYQSHEEKVVDPSLKKKSQVEVVTGCLSQGWNLTH